MTRKRHPLTILVDTREQRPLDFSPFPFVTVETATLWPGDYSVKGYEKSIAFERKSVSDLIGTMKNAYNGLHARTRARFDDELQEFRSNYNFAALIVEPDPMPVIREAARLKNITIAPDTREGVSTAFQLAGGVYLSQIAPRATRRFLDALPPKYGVHVYETASREESARKIVELAADYVESRRHVVHRAEKTDVSPW